MVAVRWGLVVALSSLVLACSGSSGHRRALAGQDAGPDAATGGRSSGGRGSGGAATSGGRAGSTSSGGARASGGTGGAAAGGTPVAGGADAGPADASSEGSPPDAAPRSDASDAPPPCSDAVCSPYACVGGACATSCAPGGSDCAADADCYDVGGDGPPIYVCLKAQGASCSDAGQCRTGNCAGGTCCDTACTSYCDPATSSLYPGATCETGTCAGTGAPAPCPNGLACLGNEACLTSCYTVWVGGFPATGFPTGLNFGNCTPAAPYCNCIPATAGGNCDGTKCCATFPCN